jgi:hypothetical protein
MPTIEYEIRTITDPDQLISAYRFVYEQYVSAGYIEPNPLGMRLRGGFEMGWNITTIGAFIDDEIVATISLIRDGDDGLPIDSHYPGIVEATRERGKVCEISNLAIDQSKRRDRSLLRDLISAVIGLISEEGDCSVFISVSPGHTRHFSKRFGFQVVGEPRSAPPKDIIQGMMLETDRESSLAQLRQVGTSESSPRP